MYACKCDLYTLNTIDNNQLAIDQLVQNGTHIQLNFFIYRFKLQKNVISLQMIDRLPELKKTFNLSAESMSNDELNQQNPYEEETERHQQQGIDDEFIQNIKSVREMIAALKNNNYRIQTIKGKYAKAIKSAQQHANSQEMNLILTQNNNYNQNIKQKLQFLQQKVKQAQQTQPNQPQTKMKHNFYISLSKQVSDVLKAQQQNQLEYKNTVKDKVTRQVRLVDKDITEEEMEEFVANPQLAQQMLQRKIYGQASITLKNTVNDIQDKFRDIQKLQASVTQCVALFNELATLVQAQGQQIDSIEANVAGAKDYVEKAQKKLQKAKQHHQCSKKCLCIAIIIGIVILAIIGIIVGVTVSNATK